MSTPAPTEPAVTGPVVTGRSRRPGTRLTVLTAAILLAAAACTADTDPEPPGQSPGPSPATGAASPTPVDEHAGMQEIEHGALLLRVPEQWQVHELSYDQVPMGGGEEITDDWLLLQTDPAQQCDLDAGNTPGVDYGCAHVMVLGAGSVAVGHGLGPMTEDNPFALGTNPGPCAEGIAADLPEPDDLAQPLVAEQAPVGADQVPYREWALACLADPEGFDLAYHLQRIWHLPDGLVVDNWDTDGLAGSLADSQLGS